MQSSKPYDWYFDFISPFSYLQREMLRHTNGTPVPVLFAGLLAHWGNTGPVEIVPKRTWTYEHCLWIAHQHGIAMQLPSAHPFNPLPLLRLCIALGSTDAAVDRLFRYVWQDGHLPTDTDAWQALLHEMSVTTEELEDATVKAALRQNGERAIAAGVFGVPAAVVERRSFWGVDATPMLLAYLDGDDFFQSPAFLQAAHLKEGKQRG
jgi:2-hydroxychromene-2-carboxylate isomerase